MRKSLGVFLISCLPLLFLASSASAHHKVRVLGDSTSASQMVFPPVTAGPGFLLPDSPFFFLDLFKQRIRLLFSFNPQERARIHAAVAGERLAELRVMFEQNNNQGISIGLLELAKETDLASANISNAAALGTDVKILAKDLNNTFKLHQKILDALIDQTKGSLKLQLKAAKLALKQAKAEVEDELPEDELENEIEDNLEDEIEDEVEEASESGRRLEHAIDVLHRLASEAARRNQGKREEALRHAIEVKNEALRKQQEKFLEEEIKKQKKLFHVKEKAAKEALEAIKKAQEAVHRFKEAKDAVKEMRKGSLDTTSSASFDSKEKSLLDKSGPSENSGPGSLNSGSSSGSGKSDDDNDEDE